MLTKTVGTCSQKLERFNLVTFRPASRADHPVPTTRKNMTDIEAVREARRTRILQMSESRLNRVMGTIKHDEKIGTFVTEEPVSMQASNCTMQNPLDGTIGLRQRIMQSDQTYEDGDVKDIESQVQNTVVKVAPVIKPVTHEPHRNIQNGSRKTSQSSTDARVMLKHFEFLRIVLCIILAYLCRRMLSAGYGVLYFESLVLPFVVLESGIFVLKYQLLHNVTLPHSSSMLIGMLMLCGIRPAILHTYNNLMGYITAITEDFAMFFFAFMMTNVFIT